MMPGGPPSPPPQQPPSGMPNFGQQAAQQAAQQGMSSNQQAAMNAQQAAMQAEWLRQQSQRGRNRRPRRRHPVLRAILFFLFLIIIVGVALSVYSWLKARESLNGAAAYYSVRSESAPAAVIDPGRLAFPAWVADA